MASFKVTGHENLLAEHGATFEFTGEDFLTLKGDCIIGINADTDFETIFKELLTSSNLSVSDFQLDETKEDKIVNRKNLTLKDINKFLKIKITIKNNENLSEEVISYLNPYYMDDLSAVFRKSDYLDFRTFGLKSNKSSKEISRDLFENNKSVDSKLDVEFDVIKLNKILFSMSDIIVSIHDSFNDTFSSLIDELFSKIKTGITIEKFVSNFERLFYQFFQGKKSVDYVLFFENLGLKTSDDFDVEYYKGELLNSLTENLYLENSVLDVLNDLKSKYKLYLYNDLKISVDTTNAILDNLNLTEYFNEVYYSETNSQDYLFNFKNLNELVIVGYSMKQLSNLKYLGCTVIQKNLPFVDSSLKKENKVDLIFSDLQEVKKYLDKFVI